MLLRKTMSLLGIGSASIDLLLNKANFIFSEKVTGKFVLRGGTVEQQIRRIDCDLIMFDADKNEETVLDTSTILSSRVIEVNEETTLPFSFMIPNEIEPSGRNVFYYFKTKLFFEEGVESKDQDYIYIKSKD